MTAQISDILINDSSVDLGYLKPFFVRRADDKNETDWAAFPVEPAFRESSLNCTSLWRGYVATMRLRADGRLELVKYEFPYVADPTPFQMCHAFFTGDFFITFRPFFFGPNTTIPFRDGRIVPNRDEWEIEDQTVKGVVTRVLSKGDTGVPYGLLVDLEVTAFAPRSLVPAEFRDDLEALVEKVVECSIVEIDEERRNIVLKIERVGTW